MTPSRTPNKVLFVNEYPLLLSPTLAAEIGLNEAIFLQQLHYWLGQSRHDYDGHTWVYNTLDQWNEQFPFWSYSTLRRTICSLREQGLIHTTDQYNRWATDRRLWYTIDYEQLSALSPQPLTTGNPPPIPDEERIDVERVNSVDQEERSSDVERENSATQDEELSDAEGEYTGKEYTEREHAGREYTVFQDDRSTDIEIENPAAQDGKLHDVQVECSAAQNDQLHDVKIECQVDQDEQPEQSSVSGSLYGTETSNIDYDIDYSETTATTDAQPDHAREEADPPEEAVVVALTSHGLSRPVALGFAQQYPEEYLCEKIAFLEYEMARNPNMSNPAGWLRRAIEQDYSPPLGYKAAQQAAAQAEEWQVILDEHNRQAEAHRQAQAQAEAARLDQEAARVAEEAARLHPLHGTTETLIHAWEEGYRSMAETMACSGFLDTLEQSILLSFADGHAKIGVKCKHALKRLEIFGKHALRNALSFTLGDLLQGRRASYELLLV